jgi:hypothetical protein
MDELPGVLPDIGVDHASLGLAALPSRYLFLSDNVPLNSPCSQEIERLVQKSLPEMRVVSLLRFANRELWKGYVACRAGIAAKNGGDPNTKLVFHGTREPRDILGSGRESNSEGFDFRRSKTGAYGRGSYFASAAAYPVLIHPKRENEDGTFSLIVAEVTLGSIHDCGNEVDHSLVVPPERRAGLQHDSVRGTEKSIGLRAGDAAFGEQFVVYDRYQAYPHFLVTLQTVAPPEPPKTQKTNLKLGALKLTATLSGKYMSKTHTDVVALEHPSQPNLYIFAVHDDQFTKMVATDSAGTRQDGRYINGFQKLDSKTIGAAWDSPTGKGTGQDYYGVSNVKLGAM